MLGTEARREDLPAGRRLRLHRRLLDADRGGFCSITVDEDIPVSRRYLDDSLVLDGGLRVVVLPSRPE
jgi:hypothetical protein